MPRILFVKTSSLGDIVHNCPAVSDVARFVPGARVDWVVEEPFAEIAGLHAAVRRVIPVAIRRWRSAPFSSAVWSELGAFRHALRDERYDFVIDSQGLVKSALVAALAAGPKHGLDRASVREPFAARFYGTRHAVPRALHAVERNRRLAGAALGYAPDGVCEYGLRAEGEAPIAVRAPFALLLTMTSRADKLWPEERWVELGRGLAAPGLQCVLPWGDEAERARCKRIADAIGGALVPPRMSLAGIARLARRARCVAGVDTGLVHLAAALGAPTVGIYCGSDPALTGLHGSVRARNLGALGAPPSAVEVLGALEALA
ncbi:MAG: lipopolysaccharide heptosyltransferase I [Burkholderiales bacterium]